MHIFLVSHAYRGHQNWCYVNGEHNGAVKNRHGKYKGMYLSSAIDLLVWISDCVHQKLTKQLQHHCEADLSKHQQVCSVCLYFFHAQYLFQLVILEFKSKFLSKKLIHTTKSK